MARLSELRVESIALTICKEIEADPELSIVDRGKLTMRLFHGLQRTSGSDPGLDEAVRRRIASLSREVPEGSREWEVLYRQYSDELAQRGRG